MSFGNAGGATDSSRGASGFFLARLLVAIAFSIAFLIVLTSRSVADEVESRFDIWEYRIEGNSLLDTDRIELAVTPYLGPQRLIEDVNEAAANLERTYRDGGYPTIYVDIPEQDVVGGVVTLRVVEGRLDRVRIEGSRYFTLSGIRHRMQSLESGKPLHVPTMQRELHALNALSPDLKVVPVLKQGRTLGAVDLDLKVNDQLPLHGSVELNNYNSANTSDTRLGVSLSYDNLWQKQHSFGMQWQTSPEDMDEVDVLVGTYIAPWFDSGNRIAAYIVDSSSNVASVGDINVIGDGTIYGVRFVMPLPSGRDFFHSLNLGADYKDYNEIIRLDVESAIQTPIDYLVWSLQYNATQMREKSRVQWNVGANFGVRGIGNSDEEFFDKRSSAHSNFVYLRASMQRTDLLPRDWQLRSTVRAQLSDSPLINNEQFSQGGVSSVRGYYESQALGDDGIGIGFEVRTPHLLTRFDAIDELRLLAFLEGAHLRVQEPLPDQLDEVNLASVGVGLAVSARRQLHLSLNWGFALRDNGGIDAGDDRLNAGLEWKF